MLCLTDSLKNCFQQWVSLGLLHSDSFYTWNSVPTKWEETCYMEGGEPVVFLYLPSGTVPRSPATCPSSWIKPWKQSLQSKCWQGRSQAPISCTSCRHNEQISTASICPLPCFWSTRGRPVKLTPISMPMHVPRTGAFPLISSSVKQCVERASSTTCKWSTKQSDLLLWGDRYSWTGQKGLRDQGLRSPGYVPLQNWRLMPYNRAQTQPLTWAQKTVQHLCCGKQSLEGSARLCVYYRVCLPSSVPDLPVPLFISGQAGSKSSFWKGEGNVLNAKFIPGALYTLSPSSQLPLEIGTMIFLKIK